jgi:alkylation response protein AidB-like acyl-CoA dehydrogenase
MNFDHSKSQETLRQKIKALFGQDEMPAPARLEHENTQEIRNFLLPWMKSLGEAGYLSLGLDDGKNSANLLSVQELLGAVAPSLLLATEASTRLFGRLLSVYGSPPQKAEILPAVKAGSLIGAVGLSESGMSIENKPFHTRGVAEGEGFRVSGSKCHVVNGPVADLIAVAGECNGGIAFFLIKKASEGFLIGDRLDTLGYNGVAISPVSLQDCLVPSRSVIGPFSGPEAVWTLRTWEDEILTAASLGLMQSALETSIRYAKVHQSGGKPIIAFQEVGFKLAEMHTLLQTARLLAYRAAWMAETGQREAALLGHCAKVFCTESAERLTSSALQILGQEGFKRGNPTEEGYRNAKYLQIAGTSSEISRMKIGDILLGDR